MVETDEKELIERCRRGEERAFRELVEKHQKRAYWLAYGMLHDHERTQDVLQEAFVRVHRNLGRFDGSRKFYTWLYQIVVNLCIDQIRRGSRHRATDLDEIGEARDSRPGPAERLERAELRRRVEETLDRLPPKYKAALTLRDLQGFRCEEIAEIVGCTNATVRWRIHRARALFKALWEGKELPAVHDDENSGEV